MSCYEEEAGDYSLPVGEYKRIKKEFMQEWDREVERSFNKAMSFYEKNANKNYREAIDALLNSGHRYEFEDIDRFLSKTKAGKLAKPKKSDVNKMKSNAIMKGSGVFEFSEAYLQFRDDSKHIHWQVDRNNRSVDAAHEHPLTKKFFKSLDTVKWTNKTGGSVRYTNEYMEEDGPTCPSESRLYGHALIARLKSFGYTQKQIKESVKDGKEVEKRRPYGGGSMMRSGGWIGRRY